jgi:hypothetical protein
VLARIKDFTLYTFFAAAKNLHTVHVKLLINSNAAKIHGVGQTQYGLCSIQILCYANKLKPKLFSNVLPNVFEHLVL